MKALVVSQQWKYTIQPQTTRQRRPILKLGVSYDLDNSEA